MSTEIQQSLDLYDKKLLYELDKDSHLSLAQLAKKLKRSKAFLIYRMKRLEEKGIITGYNAIVDMSKLGYFTFRVYFKLQQMTEEDGKMLIQFVRQNLKQVWTITTMLGKWDYALFLGVKEISEFHNIWEKIMSVYKKNIQKYNVAVYAPIHNFNRKFFLETNEESLVRTYGTGKEEEVDVLDLKIIDNYAINVRQSSIEIAKKLNVTSDTIRARIKKLEKRKIIVGYKLGLNIEQMGFVSYRVDFQLSSTNKNSELFQYCKQHPNIYQINKSIGGADFEIEVVVKDLNHLMKIINEFKKNFKEVIVDAEWFGFSTFHVLKYIPD